MADFTSTAPGQTFNGTSGNDKFFARHENITMNGGLGNDEYTLDDLGWVINDTGGIDTIFANFASFSIANRPEIEELFGTLEGGGQILTGNAGNNHIGDSGDGLAADTLIGGAGNDIIENNLGSDTMIGGTGDDLYIVRSAGAIIQENPGEGIDTVSTNLASYSIESMLNVENLYGRVATGQQLTGNAGNNRIYGRSGDDILTGGSGNDTLGGYGGNDTLIGGPGNDIYLVLTHDAADTIQIVENQFQGFDKVITGLARFSIYSTPFVEHITAYKELTALKHVFIGNSNNNELTGGQLGDTFYGFGGNDKLKGLDGADTLYGGNGFDILTGGAGKDTLTGGKGFDDFVYTRTSESTVGSGRDVIRDFQRNVDDIDLRLIDAKTTSSGNNSFSFIGTGEFSRTAGQLRYEKEGSTRTIVEGDVNGDGRADFQIELTGSITLTASDFLL
jgi:Ca2+-binding RTX toxin-like protein